RAQGNNAGRQRLRPDASLKPAKPPRGVILSSGEDVPRGQSVRARLMVLEVGPEDVAWQQITVCQKHAREGLYAQSLAGFIQWLASRYAEVRAGLRQEMEALREEAYRGGPHRRAPGVGGGLALGP